MKGHKACHKVRVPSQSAKMRANFASFAKCILKVLILSTIFIQQSTNKTGVMELVCIKHI